MNEKNNNNIATLSVNEGVDMLSELFVSAIENDISFSDIPSPMLWGPPGVGKSDAIKQIARVINDDTGKKVNITDVRLLLFNPVDLRGIPVANETRDLAIWLKPKIFDMDNSEDVVNILFLDEISAAPQSVQAAAYQITLDRVIGEHKLPDNCIVIAAGNRTTDRSVAYRMPNALANRLMHIEIRVNFESWAQWAITNNVHPLVLGYLSFDRGKLNCNEVELDQVAFTTPRSWMYVSNILNIINDTDELDRIYGLIAGCVGAGVALEFIEWCKTHSDLPDVEDIFNGKRTKYPARNDALYTLVSAMVGYVDNKEKADSNSGISIIELENACAYASGFPADYQTCLYSRLCTNEKVRMKLMNVPGFKTWISISKIRGVS